MENRSTPFPFLRTAIIIDYQNLHLTSAQLFAGSNPIHKSLIDPLRFSMELIAERNSLQKSNYPLALVTKILVYRGLPSMEHDPKNYARNLVGKPEEKGIDVLCALALVRETQNAKIDLVILASQDTDLVPALNEAIAYESAKIETCAWYSSGNRSSREIRPEGTAIWNTRLNQTHFLNSLDRKIYP